MTLSTRPLAGENTDSYGTALNLALEQSTPPVPQSPSNQAGAAQIFARESFFDETCLEQNLDPVQARLDKLSQDPTGQALVESVALRAQWNKRAAESGTGQGFAYAHIIDHEQDPPQHVWSAWVAEVAVNNDGLVDITRLTVGHSSESLNEKQATPEITSSLQQFAQGLLKPPTSFDQWGTDEEKPAFQLTKPNVDLVPQQGENALSKHIAWNEKAQWPAAAAIANAIHNATGIRLRDTPFDSRQLQQAVTQKQTSPAYKKWAYGLLGGIAATAAGLVVSAMPWRGAIAPVAVDTRIYSEEAINRGRLVAIAGDCMVCHTAENGTENTGGRALETPFGIVYSTNITPDPETGIGGWSYEAFERAMRQGIHRDGRHLYPVFPYTAFAKISDADMQSLYAYLMTQPAVKHTPPKTELAFPYNARPLMAGWNTLFHQNERFQPDPTQSTLWNRGAYLVQGAGHCAACHTPRNALGAEKSGDNNYLAGGFAEGWEAPPLTELSKAPIAWTEDTLFDYLRTGFSSLHGVASGPMAPVVEGLSQLPESDVRAIAHYLSSLNSASPESEPAALTAAKLEDASKSNQAVMTMPGESLFEGACAVCHDAREGPPLFGSRPSLALNTNLHSDHPDNVIQVLMHGIADPTKLGLGDMPGFKDSFNNQQMKDLLEYMRARFAPEKAPWQGLDEKIEAIRNQTVR
jgi:nicotinate dehydrogenase subunit B